MNLSAEEFWQGRDELPEGGRGCELCRGDVWAYPPADIPHGNAVLQLSKRLAARAQDRGADAGATCFELGILLSRRPDTLYFPAVTHFPECGPFELSDAAWTERIPRLVVEIASDPSRQQALAAKPAHYADFGVGEVWIIDTLEQTLSVHLPEEPPRVLRDRDVWTASSVLAGFELPVAELFAEPTWWNPAPRN